MKTCSSSISIQAAAESVWAILVDAPGYPAWNTTVDRVDGRIALGETVTVRAKVSPGRAFPVKVKQFAPPSRMVWGSGMPFGLFKGEREFTVTANGEGSVEFAMREGFTGILAPLIGRMTPDLQPSFDEFAADASNLLPAAVATGAAASGRRRCSGMKWRGM